MKIFYGHKVILADVEVCFIGWYYSAMKIVYLNIWNCTNKEAAEAFLRQHSSDTDVFCLQEAYEKTKWLCKGIFSDYNILAEYKHISDSENFPQITYVRKSASILFSEALLLDTPGIGLALYSHLQIKGVDVHVCNVHGVSRPGDKLDNTSRLLQSRELIARFSHLEGLKIIGGDFNLELNTESVRMFEESGYRNLIREYKIPTTRNKYVWDRYPESKQYFSDYIFVNDKVIVKEFLVPDVEASDHLPMILTFDV